MPKDLLDTAVYFESSTTKGWITMETSTYRTPELCRVHHLPHAGNRSISPPADGAFEFGRYRVLLRGRQLLADGAPVELGTRAFDLLLILLEADGALVSKEELMRRVWPDVLVSEENLKVQICALRKALGAQRDVIRTEFGRGYRFTGMLRSRSAADARQRTTRAKLQAGPSLFPRICR
jgi:DNA-binding winged helix-turn-helix (wHTH) protein